MVLQKSISYFRHHHKDVATLVNTTSMVLSSQTHDFEGSHNSMSIKDDRSEREVFLAAYTDRLSGRPGRDRIRFHVSCSRPGSIVKARLTSSICADPNPQGPGVQEVDATAWFSPVEFLADPQPIQRGSYAVSQDPIRCTEAKVKVSIWVYITSRTTFKSSNQSIWSWGDESTLALCVNSEGQLFVSSSSTTLIITDDALPLRKWFHCQVHVNSDQNYCQLEVYTQKGKMYCCHRMGSNQKDRVPNEGFHGLFYLAKDGSFNGRLEAPRIATWQDETLVAWDTYQNMTGWTIPATVANESTISSTPLVLHKHPLRGVKGHSWDGSEFCWKHRPDHYGAIHFHDDDIYDFGWKSNFTWDIPVAIPSGIYLVHLSTDDEHGQPHTESLPLFVCASLDDSKPKPTKKDRPCVLVSTFTYVMYGNHARADFDEDAWMHRVKDWNAYPYNPQQYPKYGRSTYNFHSDGSGIHFASHRRPLFNMRPSFLTFGHTSCSGLRHFPADSHLIAFLHHHQIDFDIVTDHELHQEGVAAIARYTTLITGSHPEYHSLESLNALQSFRDDHGGNLVYLGGDGFYWRIAAAVPSSADDTISLLEIRRAEDGVRTWAAEPGEYYHVLGDNPIAGYGGLWRRLDRPPQQLVGVGFTAQGTFVGMPYRRTCYEKDMEWVFKGLESHEILGDFGLSGGGAAGFELDRIDRRLDGGEHKIWILAQAHDGKHQFMFVPEEVLTTYSNLSGLTEDEARRADMIYFETESGAKVFSAGSITFCGSLPWNNFDNPISALVHNVIRRFMETKDGSKSDAE